VSEQYYTKEDSLPETTSQAIQNWQAQSNSLANVVPEVGQRLQEAGAMLGELYAKAEAEGNVEAMNSISVSWTHMETIANQTVQMDATRQAAAEVISTISKTMGDLEEAISNGDEHHPMLADYAQTIRHDEAEATYEEAIEEAYEYVAESTYDNFTENLKRITGCTWEQVSGFIEVLQGDIDLSPLKSAELKEFIESLNEPE
jgi:hypothetical protein